MCIQQYWLVYSQYVVKLILEFIIWVEDGIIEWTWRYGVWIMFWNGRVHRSYRSKKKKKINKLHLRQANSQPFSNLDLPRCSVIWTQVVTGTVNIRHRFRSREFYIVPGKQRFCTLYIEYIIPVFHFTNFLWIGHSPCLSFLLFIYFIFTFPVWVKIDPTLFLHFECWINLKYAWTLTLYF